MLSHIEVGSVVSLDNDIAALHYDKMVIISITNCIIYAKPLKKWDAGDAVHILSSRTIKEVLNINPYPIVTGLNIGDTVKSKVSGGTEGILKRHVKFDYDRVITVVEPKHNPSLEIRFYADRLEKVYDELIADKFEIF